MMANLSRMRILVVVSGNDHPNSGIHEMLLLMSQIVKQRLIRSAQITHKTMRLAKMIWNG